MESVPLTAASAAMFAHDRLIHCYRCQLTSSAPASQRQDAAVQHPVGLKCTFSFVVVTWQSVEKVKGHKSVIAALSDCCCDLHSHSDERRA